MKLHDITTNKNVTPELALEYLKEGNERFVANKLVGRNWPELVHETASGQHPFAAVLGCIDSRVPVEVVFDQGIGDIFTARVAGNVLNDDLLGSLEFACKAAGAKLIVVMGHTRCGAVNGAVNGVELGNLTGLLKKIEPAIAQVKQDSSLAPDSDAFADEVVKQNVRDVANDILSKSDILAEMEANGEIAVVRAVYTVDTGKVEFY